MTFQPLSKEEARRVLAERPSANTVLTGAAGEYSVAAELSLCDWLATVTIKNAPGTDVLAQHRYTGSLVAIQAKTASPGNVFQLDATCEQPAESDNQVVRLREASRRPDSSEFLRCASECCRRAAYASHLAWLAVPKRSGDKRRDTPRRNFKPTAFSGYEDRWELLERPSTAAPLLIDSYYDDLVEQFGLPHGHPGWPTGVGILTRGAGCPVGDGRTPSIS